MNKPLKMGNPARPTTGW